jgi:tRNA(Ile)-lysidine synthase
MSDASPIPGLTAKVFARLDARLCPRSPAPLAVAVSGGGDSVALLAMAVDWARLRGRRLLVLTVDHRLSPGSASWTRRAGEQARALGCEWQGLSWDAPRPATGLPAAARAARHALIAGAARAAGASVVMMAHTADDVAEATLRAIRRRQLYVVLPLRGRIFWRLKRLVPQGFMKCVARIVGSAD